MVEWIAATASRRGRHHEDSDVGNEDHAATDAGTPAVITVADGHGAPHYTRAARGAAFATQAMTTVLQSPPDDRARLPVELVRVWRDLVDEDVDDDPPDGHRPHERYGSTVLGARVDDALLLVQLGDGDIVLVDDDGSVRRPIDPVEYPIPGATDSLVQDDAALHVRIAEEPIGGLAVILLATDGLAAARRGGAWRTAVATDLLAACRQSTVAELPRVLDDLCVDAAGRGGDDTTLAVLVRRDLLRDT